MAWIKKNLVFVICAAVALVLLGAAGWLMFSNMGRDTEIQEELNQELANWQQLNSGAFPNQENIEAAKKEQERLRQFKKEASAVIPVATTPPKLSDQAFVNLLGTTIAGLRTNAEQSGVSLPPQFDFTFSAQRKALNFPVGSVDSWIPQLNDIEAICRIMFSARVNALDSLQRVAVSQLDTGTAEFLATGTIVSNKFGIYSPYLIGFRGFSAEVATVLEELQSSTNFIVVKSVVVLPAVGDFGTQPGGGVGVPGQVYTPRPVPEFDINSKESRPVSQPQRPRARTGVAAVPIAETVLAERPLQVTLLVEVIKLNPGQ